MTLNKKSLGMRDRYQPFSNLLLIQSKYPIFKQIIISSKNKTLIRVMTLTDDPIGMEGVCVVADGGRVRK